jgi:hypothetical protein
MTRRAIAAGMLAAAILAASGCTTRSLDEEVRAGSAADAATTTVAHERTDTTDGVTTSSAVGAPSSGEETPPETTTPVEDGCPIDESMTAMMEEVFGDDLQSAAGPRMTEVFDLIEQVVPAELAADVRTLRDGLVMLVNELQWLESQDPTTMTSEQIEQMGAVFERLDTPEMNAASERVEGYFRTACPDHPINGASEDFAPIGGPIPG